MAKGVLGLDIGGANIKAVFAVPSGEGIEVLRVVRVYAPVWIIGREGLRAKLAEIAESLSASTNRLYVAATMTAELSDVYRVKREGVHHIVDTVVDVFKGAERVAFVTSKMELVDPAEAKRRYLDVAAANWAASAWLLREMCKKWNIVNSVFIDIGSTTTTIIPLIGCEPDIKGFTDPEKLVYGELVYTGILRSNVTAIVSRVPFKGLMARVCNERFALSGDVHLVLGFIGSEDYTTETADGRGRTVQEAIERLSRVPCADAEMMSIHEVLEMARYIYEAQVFQVFEALVQIRSRIASRGANPGEFKAITAGIGEHLAAEAARRAGFREIVSIEALAGAKISGVVPAYGAALMAARLLYEG